MASEGRSGADEAAADRDGLPLFFILGPEVFGPAGFLMAATQA